MGVSGDGNSRLRAGEKSDETANGDGKRIQIAKQYVGNHLKEPITLEDAAEMVGFSPVYFGNVFKKLSVICCVMAGPSSLVLIERLGFPHVAMGPGATCQMMAEKFNKKALPDLTPGPTALSFWLFVLT